MGYTTIKTLLILNESEKTDKETVGLVLTAKAGDGDELVGSLWYIDMQMQKVDVIDAEFSSEGRAGQKGAIQVQINLLSGNKFEMDEQTGLWAYTKDDNGKPVAMDCVTAEPINPNKNNRANAILISFAEPSEEDPHFIYPHVYFPTVDGVIDPGITVHRRPPT